MVLLLPVPAIIERAPIEEVQFGLSVAVSRAEIDRFKLPRDWRSASLAELLLYLPADLHHMPPWALLAMLPGIGFHAHLFGGSSLVKTTTFLTGTSASDQTWSVLADWNSSANTVEVISHGGSASGGGGGGGGYAKKLNVTLTPSGSAKYRLRAGGSGVGTANASWLGGSGTTTLATASVGIQGAADASGLNGGAGALTTSGVGDTLRAGGTGGNGDNDPCSLGGAGGGGGGAAGPNGIGGNGGGGSAGGSGGSGGTADGGTVAADNSGTEFDGSHGCGAGRTGDSGSNGCLYGGGGAGQTSTLGAQGLIVTVNNP